MSTLVIGLIIQIIASASGLAFLVSGLAGFFALECDKRTHPPLDAEERGDFRYAVFLFTLSSILGVILLGVSAVLACF